jgi:hypothetical protein
MIPSIIEKLSYSVAAIALVIEHRMHPSDLIFAGTDGLLAVLFTIAYLRTPARGE